MTVEIKVCGITTVDDALACVQAGANALGLNFWPRSKRRVSWEAAEAIARAVGDDARLVGVVVDAPPTDLVRIRAVGVPWIQLHGGEGRADLEALLPDAYKALHVETEADLEGALRWPGDELLVDARTAELPGGTGRTADWALAARVAEARSVWLAGGLRPDNVAVAIDAVRPMGVDVASGVEAAPGVKDRAKVEAFVRACRGA